MSQLTASTSPTIAAEVVRRCKSAEAFTLQYGYAVHGNAVVGDQRPRIVNFPPAKVLEHRRNEKGCCTLSLGQYEDGSRIRFTYSENQGPSLIDLPAPVSVYV